MLELLGLSFDSASLPLIGIGDDNPEATYQFGISWYPTESQYVRSLQQFPANSRLILLDAIKNKKDFSATIFVCTLEPEAKQQNDAQPFKHKFANRDWLLVHSGELTEEFVRFVQPDMGSIKPKGQTSSELLFCWLLEKIKAKKVSSLADLDISYLHDLLMTVNQFGKVNILLSDGKDLLVYHDKNQHEPLYWMRHCPPHSVAPAFNLQHLQLVLDAFNLNHTFILFSNNPIPRENVMRMHGGQLVVVRSGELIWNSHQDQAGETQQPMDVTSSNTSVKCPAPTPPTLKETYFIPLIKKPKPVFIASATEDEYPHIFHVKHHSIYHYSSPVHFSTHLFRLQPLHDLVQSLLHYQLQLLIDDKPIQTNPCSFSGAFGNNATICEITEPYSKLNVISHSYVCLSKATACRLDLLNQQRSIPLIWMPWDKIMLEAYLIPPELPESELLELSTYAMGFVNRNNNDVMAVLNDISQTIYRDYTYEAGTTSINTTAYEVYAAHRGVCQDFVNLFICLARLLNIPARYRVGYIYTGADYKNKLQSEASHAWVEVYLPNIGWFGIDPTNYCLADKNHIRVASGRNYRDATPTSGTIYQGGGNETLNTSVEVILLTPEEIAEQLQIK